MGDVIGYKGTAEERLLAWQTMLKLRKCIAWEKAQNRVLFKPCIDKELSWYKEEFETYTAA